jgi:hypothetical protein
MAGPPLLATGLVAVGTLDDCANPVCVTEGKANTYGIPADLPLEPFLNAKLVLVGLGQYQIQLRFAQKVPLILRADGS